MFSFFNFSSIFPWGRLTPFAPMCGQPWGDEHPAYTHLRDAGVRYSIIGLSLYIAGPATWNSLPDYLRDPSRTHVPLTVSVRGDLKTFLVSFY